MAESNRKNLPAVPMFGDIDEACKRFEAEHRVGNLPIIKDYVEGWEEPERSRLLCELIGIEIQARVRAGQTPRPEDFLREFPSNQTVIREAFANRRDEQTVLPTVLNQQLKIESNLRHLRFLAEGGLGQVFVAEDETLRRDMAVKLIREDLTNDVDSCDQFRVEAEVTGRLDHPGIPIVYAIGQTDTGRLFYAMQYVRGTRLDKLIRRHHKVFMHADGSQWFGLRRRKLNSVRKETTTESRSEGTGDTKSSDSSRTFSLDVRELLELFVSVCHTIGYAHRRGILHRDIKPSNVIHGKFGETVVIDWGLALPVARQGIFKDVAEQTIAPRSGKSSRQSHGCIGTPAFMSPEQARGDVPLTPASDIFSLGTLLYCILTGGPPYQGTTIAEVRQRAIDCDFPPPTSVVASIPKPLEAICLKAMRAQISERYRTTHDLVADIREYLSDRPVSAHPDSTYRQLMRWMRHNTQIVLATLLGVLLMASTVGLVGFWKSLALLKEQRTSQVQSEWASKEKSLREQSLVLAADLAARTLANKLDVVYRTLELHATDSELQTNLKTWNETQDSLSAKRIQAWLDRVVAKEPPSMQFRSWFVMTRDGTYLARTPEFSDGVRSSSLDKNFAFRDYFHGLGQDLPPTSPSLGPLEFPHNSAAIFSTMDQHMTVNLAVPVFDSTKERLGVLNVCVECREFGDLEVDQANDQQLLLVEGRGYPMVEYKWRDDLGRAEAIGEPRWSTGTLLHHQSELYRAAFNDLPRVSEKVLEELAKANASSHTGKSSADLFKEGDYRDPIQKDSSERFIAAFCPVHIDTRADARVANTGWYVIVQQKLLKAGE